VGDGLHRSDDPDFDTPAPALTSTSRTRTIAGIAEAAILRLEDDGTASSPRFTVDYTPNLKVGAYPNDRIITVDLEQGRFTRVLQLRYSASEERAGLRCGTSSSTTAAAPALHAAARGSPPPTATGRPDRRPSRARARHHQVHRQNGSLPIQDDFVAIDAGPPPWRQVYATRNGCSQDLRAQRGRRATITRGSIKARGLLENVSQNRRRRARLLRHELHAELFSARSVQRPSRRATRGRSLDSAHTFMLILTAKRETSLTAVGEADDEQAAAYSSARRDAGHERRRAEEAGNVMRVTGTNRSSGRPRPPGATAPAR